MKVEQNKSIEHKLKLRDEEQEAEVDLEEAPMRILSWNIRGLGKP
ncbi:hypothetical protein WN944_015901 [Citrus x changshan-huyou]|uniref:Uncharacterized protein n=1 Tax=Citrus x changshan-huyou TaxID=2935761 RepID=A0AAP0QJY0_9ROSI